MLKTRKLVNCSFGETGTIKCLPFSPEKAAADHFYSTNLSIVTALAVNR